MSLDTRKEKFVNALLRARRHNIMLSRPMHPSNQRHEIAESVATSLLAMTIPGHNIQV